MTQLYHVSDWYNWITPEREESALEIVIDIEGTEPLFAQLIAQVKKAVQDRSLKPGDPLPSIRQLAGDLELNHKTVAKAYRLLERDAVIQTKGYRGTFIHPDAEENCGADLGAMAATQLAATVAELRVAGATDSEIRIAFNTVMADRHQQGV